MTSKSLLVLCVLFTSLALALSATNSNYPTINLASLKKIFDAAKPYTDLTNAFYSAQGLSLLGEKLQAQNLNVFLIKKLKLN